MSTLVLINITVVPLDSLLLFLITSFWFCCTAVADDVHIDNISYLNAMRFTILGDGM